MSERVIALSIPVKLTCGSLVARRSLNRFRGAWSSNDERYIQTSALTGFRSFAENFGGDAQEILDRVGILPAALNDPRLSVDLEKYCAVFEEAARNTQHLNFGLWFGQQFVPDKLGSIGKIAIHSPTLRAGLVNLVKGFSLYQQVTRMRLVQVGELLRIEYQIIDGRIINRHQDAELTLGILANIFRHCLGPNWVPEEVHFEHPRPEASHEHSRAFQAPVYFEQRCNSLVFRDRNLDRSMPQADLASMTRLQVEMNTLQANPGTVSFPDCVSALIRSKLIAGPPHIDEIAAELALTRRTLQRRLSEHNLTYSELLENTRRALSLYYMKQSHLSVSHVSTLLGYSEVSVFSRICRDWFGESPQLVRIGLQSRSAWQ